MTRLHRLWHNEKPALLTWLLRSSPVAQLLVLHGRDRLPNTAPTLGPSFAPVAYHTDEPDEFG